MYRSETIAAISTAMTNSGISIIRISGDKAIEIADRIFISVKKDKKIKDEKKTGKERFFWDSFLPRFFYTERIGKVNILQCIRIIRS